MAPAKANHIRLGASKKAANKIALGGQRVEIGEEWGVNAKPILVPTQYPKPTSSASAAVRGNESGRNVPTD